MSLLLQKWMNLRLELEVGVSRGKSLHLCDRRHRNDAANQVWNRYQWKGKKTHASRDEVYEKPMHVEFCTSKSHFYRSCLSRNASQQQGLRSGPMSHCFYACGESMKVSWIDSLNVQECLGRFWVIGRTNKTPRAKLWLDEFSFGMVKFQRLKGAC